MEMTRRVWFGLLFRAFTSTVVRLLRGPEPECIKLWGIAYYNAGGDRESFMGIPR